MTMKKWLSLFAFLFCHLMLFAQAGNGEYNPDTPPNPEMPRPKFTLKVNYTPQQGGRLDTDTSSIVMAGSKVWLSAYSNRNFVFERWMENGETVSDLSSFFYEMPERDASLTAVFRYEPMTPPNPETPRLKHTLYLSSQPAQAGSFNWSSGSVIREDDYVDLYAYNHDGFRFKEWQLDGQTVSTNYWYTFNMPHSDIHLLAIYEYAPALPSNPGSNFFDPETGEVIVNDFEPGELGGAIWNVVGETDHEAVTMITVVGPINDGDWYVAREYPNCKTIDLSRTNGMTGIPSWAFEWCENLESIVLPASIASIGGYAFAECTALQSLTVLSTTPPTINRWAFEGCNTENLTVFVPAASASLYRTADVWKDFNIQPLTSEVKSLEVNLPDSTGIYKGMYIELQNIASGQKQRYVITDRLTYTFNNLMHNTSYNVYLKNSKDEVLGVIENVEIINKNVEKTFGTLLVPRTVSLKVQTPDETDVTSQVTITWMDEAGTYLLRGNQITAQLDGTVLKYRITLPQALAMQYQLPEEGIYTVNEETSINYQLTDIPSIIIVGKVEDNKEHQPIANAFVSVSQTFNGQYTKSYTAKTNAEGLWQLQVLQAYTEISASKTGYVSQSQKFDDIVATIPTFTLKDISGTTITLNLSYTDVNGKTTEGYKDSINVGYSVYNVTGDSVISNFSLQYPKIVLMETHEGAELRITATSKVQKFMPIEAMATVDASDEASVTLNIKQLGGIQASYIKSDNTSIVGILYDANGKLVAKYDYANANLQIDELADGTYTLVTMGGSQFFNNIFSLSQFNNSGLRAGIDYVKNNVKVESGKWATVSNQIIPYLDETKLYYTSSKTSFTVNKSEITAGQYLTLNTFINFKSSYAGSISDVKLIVDMPASTKFVESSVLMGSTAADYTYDEAEHSVTIPVSNLNERIRFCIIPTAGGTYSPAAAVQFKFDGKTFTQPIGSVTYNVKDLSITVPSVVSNNNVPVSGSSVGKSTVKIYADEMLLGQTTSLANGAWATNIELMIDDPNTPSMHTVYAVITTQDGLEMSSESQVVTYDPNAIQVSNVIMYYTNPEENWWRGKNYELVHNFLSPSVSPFRYVYYIYNRSFTFAINFSSNDPEKITNVVLEVKTGDGRWNPLEAKYDERQKCWLVYGEFGNMYDGIVPVNVRVKFTFGGTVFVVPYPGPDADVPIDPSGYVYEAVPSNRVQGVTATIYYKETVKDMYGEEHENIVLWDAEEYAQQNPLFTDENGMYRWDVPQGLWQVKFEKEGYQTVYSEWLPVPPPQLDVNIAMTQLSQPAVKKASAFDRGVDIEFDKFMDPATLTTDYIQLSVNENIVEGDIELLNAETVGEDETQKYASKVRFSISKDSADLVDTDALYLTVKRDVMSYAGIPMQKDFGQPFNVEPKVRAITVDSLVNIEYGQERTLDVAALPAIASKSKILRVNVLSETIAKVSSKEIALDENGQAVITVTGDMPGATVITFEMDGVDLTKHTKVNVKDAALLKTIAPRASRVAGAEVYRGTKVVLTSETENAEIRYTLDGSDPNDKGILYDETPIVIADDSITIKAVAKGHDLDPSDVATFDFTLKRSTVGYELPAGWSWISHNMEKAISLNELNADITCLRSQTKEVVKDPVVGLIGNLHELQPAEAYKVEVAAKASTRLQGFECNASATPVPVEVGWNWLGYPVNQTMTLEEALTFYEASEGDLIVGQDGYAEFADGEWKGNLKGMSPGKGYMFKAKAENEIVFNNTIVSIAASRIGKRNMLINSPWAPAKYGYPNVMPLTAELFANGEKANATDYVVGAFVESECRGVGLWEEGRLLMTIYGDGGEDIRFVAKNLADDTYYDITEQVAFAADNIGSWHAPYSLTIGAETTGIGAEEFNNDFSVTPTVVDDHITVSAAGRNISYLTLTNMGGRVVLTLSDLGKGATITTSQLPAGMYIVTVKADGQTFYKKIIKS